MATKVKDPVCGMDIEPSKAAATEQYEGQTFHFCSHGCHEAFREDPHRYAHPAAARGDHEGHMHH